MFIEGQRELFHVVGRDDWKAEIEISWFEFGLLVVLLAFVPVLVDEEACGPSDSQNSDHASHNVEHLDHCPPSTLVELYLD